MKHRPTTYLPRIEEGCLVQGNPEWSHNDQFKQQAQKQWDDSSDQQSYNQGLQNLHSSESMVVLIPLYGTKFLPLWDKTAAALTDLINWDITTVLG